MTATPHVNGAPEPLVASRAPAKSDIPPGTSPAFAEAMARGPVNVPVIDGQFAPDCLEGYQRLARGYLKAGLVPDGLTRGAGDEEARIARVALVLEAGMGGLKLTAIQSMSYLMVVNNRVGVWGDAIPGLILRSGRSAGIDETAEGDGDNYTAVCTMTRMNKMPDGSFATYSQTRRFSVKDAKAAGLFDKPGPWKQYRARMMQIRARAFCARDVHADALMGLGIVEEMQDHAEPSAELKETRARTAALDTPAPAPAPEPSKPRPTPLVPVKGKFAGVQEAMGTPPAPPIDAKPEPTPAAADPAPQEKPDRWPTPAAKAKDNTPGNPGYWRAKMLASAAAFIAAQETWPGAVYAVDVVNRWEDQHGIEQPKGGAPVAEVAKHYARQAATVGEDFDWSKYAG